MISDFGGQAIVWWSPIKALGHQPAGWSVLPQSATPDEQVKMSQGQLDTAGPLSIHAAKGNKVLAGSESVKCQRDQTELVEQKKVLSLLF